jgi:O-antigen ligase
MMTLFIMSVPYPSTGVVFLGAILCGAQVAVSGRIDRHVAAFLLLLAYLLVWATMVGSLDASSFIDFRFYSGEGRVFIAYLPLLLLCAVPRDLFSEQMTIKYLRILFYLTLFAFPLCAAGLMSRIFGSHHIAGYASACLLIVFGSLYSEQRKRWQLTGVVISILLLMFANSRTTIVGLVLAMVTYYRYQVFRPKIVIGGLLFAVAALYLWSVISPFSFQRLAVLANPKTWSDIVLQFGEAAAVADPAGQSAQRVGTNYNILTRIILWAKATYLFEQSPIVGVGAFRFNDPSLDVQHIMPFLAIADSYDRNVSVVTAHNSYFQVLAEGGIVGLGIYVFPWLLMLGSLKRRHTPTPFLRAMRKMGSLSILFILYGALTGHLLAAPSSTYWVLLIAGMALRATEGPATVADPVPNSPFSMEPT